MGTNDASRTRRSAWRCVAIALGAGVTLVFGGLATPDAQANTPRISYVLPAGSGTWAIPENPQPQRRHRELVSRQLSFGVGLPLDQRLYRRRVLLQHG